MVIDRIPRARRNNNRLVRQGNEQYLANISGTNTLLEHSTGGLISFFDHLSSTRVTRPHLMEKVLKVIKSKTIRRETKSDLDGPRIPEESIRELDLV